MISLSRFSFLIFCLGAFAAAPLAAQDMPQKETPQKEAPSIEPAVPMPEPPPPAKSVPPDIPMEAFGTANPGCVEWSDSCRTCARDPENRISCSTPGIACLPQDITCKKERGQ
jgi:hypothetical protein